MTTNTEHQERMWRLAKAERECPEYYEMEPGDGGACSDYCKAGCHGTGRVPLLPGVRVKCDGWNGVIHLRDPLRWGNAKRPCTVCNDLGYVPTTNGDVWAQELWPILYYLPGRREDTIWWLDYREARVRGDFPAALEAAKEALVLEGAFVL